MFHEVLNWIEQASIYAEAVSAFSAIVSVLFRPYIDAAKNAKAEHKLHRYSQSDPIQYNRCNLSKTINKSFTILSILFFRSLSFRNQSTFPFAIGFSCTEPFLSMTSDCFSYPKLKNCYSLLSMCSATLLCYVVCWHALFAYVCIWHFFFLLSLIAKKRSFDNSCSFAVSIAAWSSMSIPLGLIINAAIHFFYLLIPCSCYLVSLCFVIVFVHT